MISSWLALKISNTKKDIPMIDKYKLIGSSYDYLSKLYSGNSIHECKLTMLREDTISPNSKVLFIGAGQGRDTLRAAELGANVTFVDISPTMMHKFETLLQAHPNAKQLSIEPVLGDILKLERYGEFDMVVINFFLNVFDRTKMTTLLNHAVKLCRPGGKLVIGDFCPPAGGLVNKSIQNVYWFAAATAFFAIAGNAVHAIYEYIPMLEKRGFKIKETRYFKHLGRNLYYSILAEKN